MDSICSSIGYRFGLVNAALARTADVRNGDPSGISVSASYFFP